MQFVKGYCPLISLIFTNRQIGVANFLFASPMPHPAQRANGNSIGQPPVYLSIRLVPPEGALDELWNLIFDF